MWTVKAATAGSAGMERNGLCLVFSEWITSKNPVCQQQARRGSCSGSFSPAWRRKGWKHVAAGHCGCVQSDGQGVEESSSSLCPPAKLWECRKRCEPLDLYRENQLHINRTRCARSPRQGRPRVLVLISNSALSPPPLDGGDTGLR